jgi:hypothetical protein
MKREEQRILKGRIDKLKKEKAEIRERVMIKIFM